MVNEGQAVKRKNGTRTFAISKACLSTVGIVLVFFARHLSGRVVGFFQALDRGFVGFDIVFVFFVVGLVA